MTTPFKNTVIVSAVVHCFVLFGVLGLSNITFKKTKKVEIYKVKLVEMPKVEKAKLTTPKASKEVLQKKEKVIEKKNVTQKKKVVPKLKPEPKPKDKPMPAPEPKPKTEIAKKDEKPTSIKENVAIEKNNESNSGEFPSWYTDLIREKIYRLWQCPPGVETKEAHIRFEIERDGTILNAVIEKGSGILTFDESALIAIGRVGKLYPLPDDFKGEKLTVHFTFRREG